jgi:prophage DNA circulation protein
MESRQVNSTTPRLVKSGRCEGRDIKPMFQMLLRHYGNVSIQEVSR